MKGIKHFFAAVALVMGVSTATAADGVQTIANYSVDFNTEFSTSGDWGPAKGWSHQALSGSVSYSYKPTAGVDGSGALYCGYKSSSSKDFVVTPRVKGAVSIKVKKYSNSASFRMVKMVLADDGTFSEGDEIAITSDELTDTAFVTVSAAEALADYTYVGLQGGYVYVDDFSAGSAEIDLYKKLEVTSCQMLSSSDADCDAAGNYKVAMKGTIHNSGDLDFNVGDEGFNCYIGRYSSSTAPYVVVASKALDAPLAVGESVEVELEATLNVADNSARTRYDLVEGHSNTGKYGAWITPIAYEPKTVITDIKGNNMAEYEKYKAAFSSFGMINAATDHQFVVRNNGAAPLKAAITVPEGFTVSKAAIEVAAHQRDTLTLTATAAAPGIYTGTMTVAVEGYDAQSQSFSLSATVLDPAKFYEPFESEKDSKDIPAGWYEVGYPANSYWSKTNYTNGANNFMHNSTSSYLSILSTPKLQVAEGEKMTFDAARTSSYSSNGSMEVYYSADRKNWTKVMAKEDIDISGAVAGTSATTDQTWSSFVLSGVPAGEYYIGFESGYACLDNVYGFKLVDVAHDVVVAKTDIPSMAMVNHEITGKVTLLNVGANAETATNAVVKFNGEEVAAAEVTFDGKNAVYEFNSITPYEAGEFPMVVTFKWADGYEVATDTIMVTVAPESASKTVTVGEATSTTNTPLYLNYYNSVSETLYTADMLAAAGLKKGDKISSITYRGYKTAAEHTTTVKLFVMNCADTAFGDADMTADADMTKVYDGDYTFVTAGTSSAVVDMLVLTFAEPFVYDGGALRVKVQSESSAYKSVYFEADGNVANMCYGSRSDGTKVADMTSFSAFKFPVTNFGIVVDPQSLTGKVTNESGEALEGVKVTIALGAASSETEDGVMRAAQPVYTGVTDANGEYSIPVVQTGEAYTVTYEKDGYKALTVTYDALGAVATVVLEEEVHTGVTDVTVSEAINSNVYSIDGRLVKAGASSLEGLDRGIYIFRGKKVVVK